MQNLHADGLYHEPASKCNFDLNRQNTLLLNLFDKMGRKNTTLDGMYHMLLVTVYMKTTLNLPLERKLGLVERLMYRTKA